MAKGQIAHLEVTCPKCGKYTGIYVLEGGTESKVKCQFCHSVFEFGAGMMYNPVGYVPEMPAWAIITGADKKKVKQQAVKCGQCGYEYTKSDASMQDAFSKTANESDSPLGALLLNSPAFKSLVGVKVLFKCGSCGKIACSECSLESSGITQKKCPFCQTDYTVYSEIKPDASNTNDRASTSTETIGDGAKKEGFFKRLFSKK